MPHAVTQEDFLVLNVKYYNLTYFLGSAVIKCSPRTACGIHWIQV